MNKNSMQEWLKLTDDNRKNIFLEVAKKMNLPPAAVEKDWWVVRVLDLVFQTEIAPHTVFKGGTSLSKAWGLIDRFSEDIDLALDRSFLGFTGEMNGSQVKKLRQTSKIFISEEYFPQLQKAFQDSGLTEVTLKLRETTSNDQDPLIIEVIYPGVTELSEYLQPRIIIEIGCRSLKEPFSEKSMLSYVGEHFSEMAFADKSINIPTVNPERTFLEKIFLLHEEFQLPHEKIKVNRLSRHLYDIEKIMDTGYGELALKDQLLYQHIVEHRKMITPIRGIDYSNHAPEKIVIVPPKELISAWKKDYEIMQQSMIYGNALIFEDLMAKISELNTRINKLAS